MKDKLSALLKEPLPEKVPAYPKSGTSIFLYVEIVKVTGSAWYAVGEKYKVPNKIYWGFNRAPSYVTVIDENGSPQKAISIEDCEALKPGTVLNKSAKIPTYTLKELEDKIGPFWLDLKEYHLELIKDTSPSV